MAADSQDAITLLTADHEEVRKLFGQVLSAGIHQKQQLALQITEALKAHTTIEEEIFYPALQSKLADQIREARSEHQKVDQLLRQMSKIQAEDVRFTEMLTELQQNVEHHAGEEEREMFPQARELLGQDTLRQLGQQLQQRKQALVNQRGRAA